MSIMKRNNVLVGLCMLSALLMPSQGADAAVKATFSEFTYKGEDSKFTTERLSDEGDVFNPVISGWASDPSIVRTGDDYWLVTSTFGYFPGVPLYHSKDLVNWKQVGNVLSRESQLPWLKGVSLGKGGIYAPDIKYNPHNGLYYMITTCVTDEGRINFYVTAKDPLGEWSEPTVLEKVEGIDPSFFFDDDGRAYIPHKPGEGRPVKWSNTRALAIIEFDTQSGKTVGNPVPFKEEGVGPEEHLDRNEGPHIYKIDGKYYLIAAEGGTGNLHSEVCYKADAPMGPYTRWSRNPMLTQRGLKPNRTNPVTCTGHADIFTTPEGDWYSVFLGCRPWDNGSEQLGRETFLMPLKWSKDGFPYIVQSVDTVKSILNIPGAVQNSYETGNIRFTDNFKGNQLDPSWLSMWGPADKHIRFGEKGLEMDCAAVDSRSGETPAYIGRRIKNHAFTVTTTVTLDKEASGDDAAGILIVKGEKRQIFFAVTPHGIKLMKSNDEVLADQKIEDLGQPVNLRATCADGKYRFFYSLSGGLDWTEVPATVDTGYVSSSQSGFTGTTVGIFATSVPF